MQTNKYRDSGTECVQPLTREMRSRCARASKISAKNSPQEPQTVQKEWLPDLAPFSGADQYFLEEDQSKLSKKIQEDNDTRSRGKSKAGRKKGDKKSKDERANIAKAMKGKNTYKKSGEHRSKIGEAMRLSWKKRRASGEHTRMTSIRCSVCGRLGHNKRTCPS